MRDAPTRRDLVVPVRFNAETRDGRPVLRGKAAVFNSVSEDLGFRETLQRGCFRNALARGGRQLLLLGHDYNSPLARRPGTLTLSEDSEGLAFEATLPNTSLARDVTELVSSGVIDGCSFSFTVGADSWDRIEGEDHRNVSEVAELYEVTLTPIPAYPATSVAARSASDVVLELRSRAAGKRAARIPRPNAEPEDPYAEGKQSWYRDLAILHGSEQRAERDRTPGSAFTDKGDPHIHPPGTPTVGQARERIERARRLYEERSALTTTPGAGGELVPKGMPAVLSEDFTTAARAWGVMPDVLGYQPIPKESGWGLAAPKIPGFTTSAIEAEVQAAEGEAIVEQSPKTAYQSSGVEMLSATITVSQQLVDLAAAPGFDQEITRELAAALATKRDVTILNGKGSEGQTLGILNATGITATTYTDATPTGQKYIREGVAKCWSEVATALGHRPDTILLSPTFYAWLYSGADTSKRPLESRMLEQFVQPTEVPAMPLKLGGAKNEQPTIVLFSEDVRLYLAAPQVVAAPDIDKSGELVVRFTIRQLCALVVRKPAGVGTVLGSGVKEAPVFN